MGLADENMPIEASKTGWTATDILKLADGLLNTAQKANQIFGSGNTGVVNPAMLPAQATVVPNANTATQTPMLSNSTLLAVGTGVAVWAVSGKKA